MGIIVGRKVALVEKYLSWGAPEIRIEGVGILLPVPDYVHEQMIKLQAYSSIYIHIWASLKNYWCSKSCDSFSFSLILAL